MKRTLKKATRQAIRELKKSTKAPQLSRTQSDSNLVRRNDEPSTISHQSNQGQVFSDNDPEVMEALKGDKAQPLSVRLEFSSTCPYCGVILDKPIKRKRNCPDCSEVIYVRTTQDLYPSSALTKDQVNDVDFYETMKSMMQITKYDYSTTEESLMNKWNKTKVNTYDILWSMFNNMELYTKYADRTYDKQSQMRNFFRTKEWVDVSAAKYQAHRGHDPSDYLAGARRNAVQSAKLEKSVKGLTVKCYSCCDECMKFDEKTFSIAFLDKNDVLPNKLCTHPLEEGSRFTFCTCSYQEYYQWDS